VSDNDDVTLQALDRGRKGMVVLQKTCSDGADAAGHGRLIPDTGSSNQKSSVINS